jgi:hypothetical protein
MEPRRNNDERRRPSDLIAIFPDAEHARQAVADLASVGVADADVDYVDDYAVAVRGEMEEELDRTWGGGVLGAFVTDDMSRPAIALAAMLGLLGAAIGAALTVWLGPASDQWWVRAAIGAVVGSVFLGTVGALIGGGFGARHPDEDIEIAPGAAVIVHQSSPLTVATLERRHPLRIDRFQDDQSLETIIESEHRAPERLGRGLADPSSR